MVGADWKTVDWNNESDPYYYKHTWTEAQEKEFTDWLGDYLYSSAEAREIIMRFPRRNKKYCHEQAYWFVWNHGWKTLG